MFRKQHQYPQWSHLLSRIVDRLIPYCLVLLLGIIILELWKPEVAALYHHEIMWFDIGILSVFGIDLVLKYVRVHDVKIFVRRYWIEIIAMFPAFLVVRLFEEVVRVANLERSIFLSQEAIELGERSHQQAARSAYFQHILRPIARLPRFLKAIHYYEHPHHFWEKKKSLLSRL